MSDRVSRINKGEQIVVGLNRWTEGLPSPLLAGDDGGIFKLDPESARETLANLARIKASRDAARAARALERLKAAAKSGENMMEPSIECALARVTTGEWADALREVFGEYRPVTGIEGQKLGLEGARVDELRKRIEAFAERAGHRPRMVVGKPGLDGHSNGAEVIAVAARHTGFDVIYSGIRLTPEEIVQSAVEENADVIGISILSGSHLEIADQLMQRLKTSGAGEIPVVVGGIIPASHFEALKEKGIRAIFTPSDYELIDIMEKVLDLVTSEEKAGV
jgi:(2R)-ethylmalonyl-CoA mutase